MSAYKRLNKQDAYITTYVARKSWAISGSEYLSYNINNLTGFSGSEAYIIDSADIHKGQYKRAVYQSIYHLYYSGFLNGLPVTNANSFTGSAFDNYLQSSLNVSGSRNIGERIAVFSIPRDLIGTHIQPGSFSLTPSGSSLTSDYVSGGYSEGIDYVETFTYIYGSNRTLTSGDGQYTIPCPDYVIEPAIVDTGYFFTPTEYSSTIVDDEEGNLYYRYSEPRKYVGNIVYTHGQAVITDDIAVGYFNNYVDANLTWKSNHPIYTHNYHCKVKESEFNSTLNPSALGESTEDRFYNDGELYLSAAKQTDGTLLNNLTGSEFQPYITTVGLYNDAGELIAVGKLSQPIPKSANTDMTFILRIDI
jgi:hypothetical protein